MINVNSNLNKNKPFLLKPVGKDYLWGGSRLNDTFGKEIDMSPLAETWECSTHPDGYSVVVSGEYSGKTLSEVLKEHPEYLGTHPQSGDELPILVKFIDAKQNLSVQVHPDDAYAFEYENGQKGKTEVWYVLDATPDAELIYGFRTDVKPGTVKKGIETGNIEKYLQKVKVHKDDVFFIEAGTVHAIGAGALIAEIQENSNLTYRLYDYNRVDKKGNFRELHIDKALQVMNFKRSDEPKQPMRVLKYRRGMASEFLCRCKYFEVDRVLINTERYRDMVSISADENSFVVLLCLDGCGSATFADGQAFNIFKGDCVFIPANSVEIKLHGKMQFLKIFC